MRPTTAPPIGAFARQRIRSLRVLGPMLIPLALCFGCSSASDPPSVLLVTLDTTRVDHLSCYGYPHPTSPNLDALAAKSVLFERAWSTSAWTLPAHASLFTGLFPVAHRAQFDLQGEELRLGFRARSLAPEFVTLAELLSGRGYDTGAFVAGPWLKRQFGALQGFATIEDEVPPLTGRDGAELTDSALQWLARPRDGAPVFLFVNYFDPHYPYRRHANAPAFPGSTDPIPNDWLKRALAGEPIAAATVAALRGHYDAEIHYMDAQLGRLLAGFTQLLGENTLIVVTSDHGESFGEDGFFLHNGSLGEEATRVPLVVRYPVGRDGGTRNPAPIQLTDVAALIARETNLELPSSVEARLPGERERLHLALKRNASRIRRFGSRYDRDLEAVIEWPHKLVVPTPGTPRLSRIDGPLEVPVEDAALQTRLEGFLREHRARSAADSPAPVVELEDDTLESLRALGYLD